MKQLADDRRPSFWLAGCAVAVGIVPPLVEAAPDRNAERYVAAVEQINREHAENPGETTEDELAGAIPRAAVVALAELVKMEPGGGTAEALVRCGEAALDIAQVDHFGRIRTRLLEIAPESAATLGQAAVRKRFLVRGIGDLSDGYTERFADLCDAILDAYDEVFGFEEWSKVPGKKVRIRVHLEEAITRPPHFAPQFPYHSEIDLPVVDREEFRSPTEKGQMMFYGLCHEFGHLIAMWGDRRTEEDHHAWAHYTGVTIVEHMAATPRYADLLGGLRDVRWRSLSLEREKEENRVPPSLDDRVGVLSLFIALHDAAGPEAIGAAFNAMEQGGAGHRINHVRYYRFADLERALAGVIEDRGLVERVRELIP